MVTAGNPPEYNNSVREFDIVTWDRLKRIDVEPDYDVWKEYAHKKGIHPAILTYLDIKKSDFYKIETTVDGKRFVTARGWSDLSDMILLSERHGIPVDDLLAGQYLQNKKIAKEFAIYYDLWCKYRSDYQVDKILAGRTPEEIKNRAKVARFDERLALLGLLLDSITGELKDVCLLEQALTELLNCLKAVRMALAQPQADAAASLQKQTAALDKKIAAGKLASSLSQDGEYACRSALAVLGSMEKLLQEKAPADGTEAFQLLKADFDRRTGELRQKAEAAGKQLSNVFTFCEEVFGKGQELLILVTELTTSHYCARFISRYGCKEYFKHNKELLFHQRQKEIIQQIQHLDL